MTLFELRRALADKQVEGRAIVQKAVDEKRSLNPEETTKVGEVRSAIEELQH